MCGKINIRPYNDNNKNNNLSDSLKLHIEDYDVSLLDATNRPTPAFCAKWFYYAVTILTLS